MVITLFVSLIVWFVLSLVLGWMPPSNLLLSLILAIVGGFVGFAVLRALKNFIPPKTSTKIVFAALGSILILFLAIYTGPKSEKSIVANINCDKLYIDRDPIVVGKGGTVIWTLSGKNGTPVEINSFRHHIIRNWKRKPIPQEPLTGIVPGQIGPIPIVKSGRFKYSFTCGSNVVDPMFDVPPR